MNCPGCGYAWRRHDDAEIGPEAGDVTICGFCGRVLRFTRSLLGGPLRLSALSERDERKLRAVVRERLRDLQPKDVA